MRLRNENHNTSRSFNSIRFGGIIVWFSYETPVAFQAPGLGIVVSENIWSNTTGRHLSWLARDISAAEPRNRVPNEEFERKLRAVIEIINESVEREISNSLALQGLK